MAAGRQGRGKRGRIRARCWVVRRSDIYGTTYAGVPNKFDAHPVVGGRCFAREFATADEAREEIGARILLGRAREGFWKVYRRGRREEG